MIPVFDLEEFATRYDLPGKRTFDKVTAGLPTVLPAGPWLAGGALRRLVSGDEPDSDWDFFFCDVQQANAFDADMTARKFTVSHAAEHAKTYVGTIDGKCVKVQAVTIGFYETPAAVIDSFDFTNCQLCWDGTTLYAGTYTMFDIGRKRLAVHKITYAAASVRRMLKYQTQGYTICNGAIKTLLEAVSADPKLIHSEVTYVD